MEQKKPGGAKGNPAGLIAIIACALAAIAIVAWYALPSKQAPAGKKTSFEEKISAKQEKPAEPEPEEAFPEPDLVITADADGLKVNGESVDDLSLRYKIAENVKTVRVDMSDDADALALDVVSIALAGKKIFTFQLAGADGKTVTEITIPEPQKKPSRRSGFPTIDLQEVRVKLLWYSPDGRPRYSGDDGHVVLKPGRSLICHKNNDHAAPIDWEMLKEYLAKKKKEYRPPPHDPLKTLPVIIDARKYVPTTYVEKVVEILAELGIRNVSIAAPEIPY